MEESLVAAERFCDSIMLSLDLSTSSERVDGSLESLSDLRGTGDLQRERLLIDTIHATRKELSERSVHSELIDKMRQCEESWDREVC